MKKRIFQYFIVKIIGSGGIRTHASEETGALNQRLRPLGHATHLAYLTGKLTISAFLYMNHAHKFKMIKK